MARVTRASKPKSPAKDKASPAKTTLKAKADTPVKSTEKTDNTSAVRTNRQKRQGLRHSDYKRQQRKRALQALKVLEKDPNQSLSKAERNQTRAQIYRQWKPKKLSGLEQVVLRQQEEIKQLRQQVGGASKSPDAAEAEAKVGSVRGGRRARKSTA